MTRLFFLPLISATLAATAAQAADSVCQPMINASMKVFTTPVHLYMSKTAAYTGGKVESSETIYLNNSTYVYLRGKWQRSPITPQGLLEMRKKASALDPNTTCRQVREESVNGEVAVVYSVHRKTPEDQQDTQTWISKTRGLPLRTEIDLDVGGKLGKSHTNVRYDYTNVQAPGGVR
jgi:hypothetical protein